MKRALILLSALALAAVLFGCGAEEAEEPCVSILIRNDQSLEALLTISMQYDIGSDNREVREIVAGNADGSLLSEGEELIFALTHADIAEGQTVGIQFCVQGEMHVYRSEIYVLENVRFGSSHYFVLAEKDGGLCFSINE